MNILAMAKGPDRYVFHWDDASKSKDELYRTFDKFAENDDLNFSPADAVLLKQWAEETYNKPVEIIVEVLK